MTRVVPVVAAVLEDADGQVLVVQRPTGQHYPLFWEFPGGKIEEGESPEEALSRELEEELGLQVAPEDFQYIHQSSHTLPHAEIQISFFLCQKWVGVPKPLLGQPDLRWVDRSDLPKYPMPDPNVALMEILRCRKQNA